MYLIKSTLFVSLISCIFLVSCNDEPNDSNFTIHPNEANSLNDNNIDNIILKTSLDNAFSNTEVFEEVDFKNLSSVIQIGQLDGVREELFSNIDQVIVNGDKIYILDSNNVKISIFSLYNGEFLGTIGDEGRGPGELTAPTSFDINENKMFISDRSLSVKVAEFNSDSIGNFSEFQIDPVFKTPIEQTCINNNSLLIKSTTIDKDDPKLLHEIDIDSGTLIKSLVDPYDVDDLVLQEVLSEGIITCNSQENTVVIANYILPYLHSYTTDGELNWISKIEDYKPLKFREESNGSVSTRWNNDDFVYNEYSQLFFHKGNIILQIKKFSNSFLEQGSIEILETGIDTYHIDSETGNGYYLGEDIPQIEFMNDEIIVVKGPEKYPNVKIIEL